MDISSRIRELRKRRGLNQFELSEEVGVSVDSVRRWESNRQFPRADELGNLASVLKVTVDELLNGQAEESWELRLVMRRAGDPQEGVMDMTTSGSNAALYMEDSKMAIMLSADYALWEDDAKFEELIEQLRRKRTLGLKSRHEGW
ncbi:MAG: helix-turn-helix transcriptional regulator [Synergistaceae bacterium]|nr:helix-turn-helix transcriptional regulator [Synergistaceae bacterium]